MRKIILVLALVGVCIWLALAQHLAAPANAEPIRPREMAYGKDRLQTLDFWRGEGGHAPLIIFLHGGGWSSGDKDSETGSAKVAHYVGRGYAFAALNYRLAPDVTIAEQVQDVADATGYLAARSAALGIDPKKIILMGHSSGGHLAALIGADPRFLAKAGLDVSTIRGVVLLDGAGLVPRARTGAPRPGGPFTSDAERRILAPVNHATKPNAAGFLFLNASSEDLRQQAKILADALEAAGTPAEVHPIDGTDHMALSENLGVEGDPATTLVDGYLRRVARN
ncbi:MAG: esterase [Caulobacter sp.]|nr:esterase [Caulobacter sp.]